jgi:L-lactate utilization protein LutB
VKSVESNGTTAKVICAHEAPPADAIVTQVVTEHAALVESKRMPADAQEVTIWLSTKGRDGSTSLHESCKIAR